MEGEDGSVAKQKGSDLFLKIASLILSFSLWIYIINVENPIKTMRVYNVPVRLENLENIAEQNLALLPNQDIMVTLQVTGPASEVYRSVASNFRVVADLDDLALKAGPNEIPIEITSYPSDLDVTPSSNVKAVIYLDDYLEREVNIVSQYETTPEEGYFVSGIAFNPARALVKGPAQYVNRVKALAARGKREGLNQNFKEIISLVAIDENENQVEHVVVTPLYVEITAEVFETKTVPIIVDTGGEVSDGYELLGTSVGPGELLIAGPDSLLDQVSEIYTEEVDLSSITESSEIIMNLVIPQGIISVNGGTTATVTVDLEAYETKTISKKLTTIGLQSGFTAEISSNSINIIVSGSQSALEEVTEESITADLDLTGLDIGEYELSPNIVLPVGILQVSYTPNVISVNIRSESETPGGADEETPPGDPDEETPTNGNAP